MGHSRAATGHGAGRARCGLHEHGRQQEQTPPDMRTGQSAFEACLRREVPTDHEAHSLVAAATAAESRNDCASAGLQPRGRSGRQSSIASTLRPSARAGQSRISTKSRSNQALETRTFTHRAGRSEESGPGQSSKPRTVFEGSVLRSSA